MRIEMTRTIQGSLDGETVRELAEGEQYDTVHSPRGDRLAQYHIRAGAAVPATVKASPPEPASMAESGSKQPKKSK